MDRPLSDVGVLRFPCSEDPRDAFDAFGAEWDRCLSKRFLPEHRLLIKINLNTADPYPASTSPDFLAALVDFLMGRGMRHILVGDCSANTRLPTRRVAKAAGIADALAGRAKMMYFDESTWVRVPIDGFFLKQVTVPRIAMEADRVISLANLKTHAYADFTMGFKLAVGFMHPVERKLLHLHHLREKTVEISLAVPPDLIIVDGRSAFITQGPNKGRLEHAGVVLVGDSLLQVDAEAYRELYRLKERFGCLEHFEEDPYETIQLRHARKVGFQ
ncbi:MAG: DUF362 domain-containing protein [Deltaproteobacteria bacterium]|nr:DUF362 domain-containing protein [Deltaproteobacteria bacterium]